VSNLCHWFWRGLVCATGFHLLKNIWCHLVSSVWITCVIFCSHSGEQKCFCAVAVQLYFELSSGMYFMCLWIAGCVWAFKFPQMRMRIGTAECALLKSKRILQTKRRSPARRKWLHKTSYVNLTQRVLYITEETFSWCILTSCTDSF